MKKVSRIPVGTQFSPALVDLLEFVKAAVTHSGHHDEMADAVTTAPVRIVPYENEPTHRMRNLPLEAAVQYGLLAERTYEATELAQRLSTLPAEDVCTEFARHILLRLGGLRVVQATEEMAADGLPITGDTLAKYLTDQGFFVAEHNTAINTLRMWLAKAGLYPSDNRKDAWRPDPSVKEQLVGLENQAIAALLRLSPAQQAFALTIARLNPEVGEKLAASEIRELTEVTHDVHIGRGSLPNEVLKPLKLAGLIDFETKGTGGGKTSQMWITDSFVTQVVGPFIEHTLKDLDPVISAYYMDRPKDIVRDLGSGNTYEAGKALEALVVVLMRCLGLRFVGWRRRASETGYSEVDVLMAGMLGALPTTWQIQCKNTPSAQIRLEDVAREVGLLPLTKATHILMVANAKYTTDAIKFANATVQNSPVSIFLLDKDDLENIVKAPESLGKILREKGEMVLQAKSKARVWEGIQGSSGTKS